MEDIFAEKLAMILLEQAGLLTDDANDFESDFDEPEIVVINKKEK